MGLRATDSFMAPEKKSKGLSSFLGMPLATGVGLGIADAIIGCLSVLLMMSCVMLDKESDEIERRMSRDSR